MRQNTMERLMLTFERSDLTVEQIDKIEDELAGFPLEELACALDIYRSLRSRYSIAFLQEIMADLTSLSEKDLKHAIKFVDNRNYTAENYGGGYKSGRWSKVKWMLFRFEQEDFDKNDPARVAAIVEKLFDRVKPSRATRYRFISELLKKGYPVEKIKIW